MTTKEIIADYIKQHGFDGLCRDDCGCGLDMFMPCGMADDDCQPAYKQTEESCKKCINYINCHDEDENTLYCTRRSE